MGDCKHSLASIEPSDPLYEDVDVGGKKKRVRVSVGIARPPCHPFDNFSACLSPNLSLPARFGRYHVSVLTYTTLSPMFPSPQRTLPEGLSKRDRKVLQKIKSRAHYLDKGMNLCGLRVGWTFWIVSQASPTSSRNMCRPQADEFLNCQLVFQPRVCLRELSPEPETSSTRSSTTSSSSV